MLNKQNNFTFKYLNVQNIINNITVCIHLWRTGNAHGLSEQVDRVGGQLEAGGREHLELELLRHRGLQDELLNVADARVAHLRRDQSAQARGVARGLAHEHEHHLHAALVEHSDRRDRVRRRAVRERALAATLGV